MCFDLCIFMYMYIVYMYIEAIRKVLLALVAQLLLNNILYDYSMDIYFVLLSR